MPRYIIGAFAGLQMEVTTALAAALGTRVFHAGSAPSGDFLIVGETRACVGKNATDAMVESAWNAGDENALPGTSCSTWGLLDDSKNSLCVYIGRKRPSQSSYHEARGKARSAEWYQRELAHASGGSHR